MDVRELIERLQQFPPDWQVYATKAGSSIEVWEPGGTKYAYVFTDEREPKHLTSRRRQPPIGGTE